MEKINVWSPVRNFQSDSLYIKSENKFLNTADFY